MKKITSGFVSVIGRTNAGKSSLLNALAHAHLALVSKKANATRKKMDFIIPFENEEFNSQIIFLDTPGISDRIIRANSADSTNLANFMFKEMNSAIMDSDLALFIAVASESKSEIQKYEEFINKYQKKHILILNKIDKITHERLLKILTFYQKYNENYISLIPLSAKNLTSKDKNLLLSQVAKNLPEHPHFYDNENLSTTLMREIYKEVIRECIYELFSDEIPYKSEPKILTITKRPAIFRREGKLFKSTSNQSSKSRNQPSKNEAKQEWSQPRIESAKNGVNQANKEPSKQRANQVKMESTKNRVSQEWSQPSKNEAKRGWSQSDKRIKQEDSQSSKAESQSSQEGLIRQEKLIKPSEKSFNQSKELFKLRGSIKQKEELIKQKRIINQERPCKVVSKQDNLNIDPSLTKQRNPSLTKQEKPFKASLTPVDRQNPLSIDSHSINHDNPCLIKQQGGLTKQASLTPVDRQNALSIDSCLTKHKDLNLIKPKKPSLTNHTLSISALIIVEKESQKSIIIGKGARSIKALRSLAKKRCQTIAGVEISLHLRVKVLHNWSIHKEGLRYVGYKRS